MYKPIGCKMRVPLLVHTTNRSLSSFPLCQIFSFPSPFFNQPLIFGMVVSRQKYKSKRDHVVGAHARNFIPPIAYKCTHRTSKVRFFRKKNVILFVQGCASMLCSCTLYASSKGPIAQSVRASDS